MAVMLPQIIAGDSDSLLQVIKEHRLGLKRFASLRSRYLLNNVILCSFHAIVRTFPVFPYLICPCAKYQTCLSNALSNLKIQTNLPISSPPIFESALKWDSTAT